MISLFSASIGFLMPLVSWGILYSTGTDYFKLNRVKFRSFVSSTFFLPALMSASLGVIFFFFFQYLKIVAGFQEVFIWLLPLVVYCNFLIEQNLILVRNNNQPTLFFWINIFKTIVEIGVAIFLIVAFHYGWLGRILGTTVAFFLFAIFALFYLFRKEYLPGKFRIGTIKKEIVYSIPAITMQLSIFCITTSDRYFINYYYGEERTGVYSLAATFASVILIFCMAILQFFSPKIYQELSKTGSTGKIKTILWQYCLAILGAYLALVIFTPIAYHYFIGRQFVEGLPYFFLLVTGNGIWCIAFFLYSFLLYYKAKRKIFFLSFSTILISMMVNNILIKLYGEMGAAISAIVNCTYIFALILFATRRYFKSDEKAS